MSWHLNETRICKSVSGWRRSMWSVLCWNMRLDPGLIFSQSLRIEFFKQRFFFLCTVLLGNEWFFGDKAGSENRSLECPVLLKPRQNHTFAWDSMVGFLNRQLAKNNSFGEWTVFEHKEWFLEPAIPMNSFEQIKDKVLFKPGSCWRPLLSSSTPHFDLFNP
jgi:hypothetical protein